jgi:hypothetical protein
MSHPILPSYPFCVPASHSTHPPLISFNNNQHPARVDNDLVCVASAYPAHCVGKGDGCGGEGRTRICGFTFGFLVLGAGFRYVGALSTLDGRPSKSRGCLSILHPGGRHKLNGLFRLGVQIGSPSCCIHDIQHTSLIYYSRTNIIYILNLHLPVGLRHT